MFWGEIYRFRVLRMRHTPSPRFSWWTRGLIYWDIVLNCETIWELQLGWIYSLWKEIMLLVNKHTASDVVLAMAMVYAYVYALFSSGHWITFSCNFNSKLQSCTYNWQCYTIVKPQVPLLGFVSIFTGVTETCIEFLSTACFLIPMRLMNFILRKSGSLNTNIRGGPGGG